ncbi:MAG: hypothetical protein SGCHY_004153 [Lobulomycetales sp.]
MEPLAPLGCPVAEDLDNYTPSELRLLMAARSGAGFKADTESPPDSGIESLGFAFDFDLLPPNIHTIGSLMCESTPPLTAGSIDEREPCFPSMSAHACTDSQFPVLLSALPPRPTSPELSGEEGDTASHGQMQRFKCSQCPQTFTNRKNRVRHEGLHRNMRKHVCPVCNRAFNRRDYVRKHIKVHRSYEKSFTL